MRVPAAPLVVGLCVALGSDALAAQSGPPRAVTVPKPGSLRPAVRLIGVFDDVTAQPLDSAEVVDLLNGNSMRTSVTGTALLHWLSSQNDSAAVQVRKVGYEEKRFVVLMRDTADVTVTLRKATTLGTVTVTDTARRLSPNIAGFEERRNRGAGKFVTPNELRLGERQGNTKVFDVLLKKIPPFGSRTSGRGCQMIYFVDHVQVRSLPSTESSAYEALEYYSHSTAPAQFSGTAPPGREVCGVIVAWGRERP